MHTNLSLSPDLAASALPGPSTPSTAPRPRRATPSGSPTARPVVQPVAHAWYQHGKAAMDFALAVLLTIPAVPVVLFAALLVKLTSRGPAFYTQTRVGRNGRLFQIVKLRTMLHNCESLTGPRWSLPGDPRVTPVGWFLRKSHIDELPQLINVLRGEMSLVGPRPERPEFIPDLERALPAYRQRLNVRPGVTGLAQVQLPPDTDIDSVRRKLAHDLYYVRHLSPWLDLRLLIATVFYALGASARVLCGVLGVTPSSDIEHAMRDVVPDVPLTAPLGANGRPRLAA